MKHHTNNQSLSWRTLGLKVLGGSKDVQVTRTDFDALTRARPKIESLWVSEMTHALKALPNGALQQRTYTDPSLPLASKLMSTINGFLKQ